MNGYEWMKWHWKSGCPVTSCGHQTIHDTCRWSLDRNCDRKKKVVERMAREAMREDFEELSISSA